MTKSKRRVAPVAGRPRLTPAEQAAVGGATFGRVRAKATPACVTTQLHSQAENINANSNVHYVVGD